MEEVVLAEAALIEAQQDSQIITLTLIDYSHLEARTSSSNLLVECLTPIRPHQIQGKSTQTIYLITTTQLLFLIVEGLELTPCIIITCIITTITIIITTRITRR